MHFHSSPPKNTKLKNPTHMRTKSRRIHYRKAKINYIMWLRTLIPWWYWTTYFISEEHILTHSVLHFPPCKVKDIMHYCIMQCSWEMESEIKCKIFLCRHFFSQLLSVHYMVLDLASLKVGCLLQLLLFLQIILLYSKLI